MRRGPPGLGEPPPQRRVTRARLSLQIPEEHDLESQILKEREWRFLRNARVRRQARRLIQKGEGRGGAAPNTHALPLGLCSGPIPPTLSPDLSADTKLPPASPGEVAVSRGTPCCREDSGPRPALAATTPGTEGGGDSPPPLSWGQAGMGGPAAAAQDITQVPSLSGRDQPHPGSPVLRPAVGLRRQAQWPWAPSVT